MLRLLRQLDCLLACLLLRLLQQQRLRKLQQQLQVLRLLQQLDCLLACLLACLFANR